MVFSAHGNNLQPAAAGFALLPQYSNDCPGPVRSLPDILGDWKVVQGSSQPASAVDRGGGSWSLRNTFYGSELHLKTDGFVFLSHALGNKAIVVKGGAMQELSRPEGARFV